MKHHPAILFIAAAVLCGSVSAPAQAAPILDFAVRVGCDFQQPEKGLMDLHVLQGSTPLVLAMPQASEMELTPDTNTSVRMIIGPSETGSIYAVRTNYAIAGGGYAIDWPTIGTNSSGQAWFYTLLFDREGKTYWSGSGALYIDSSTYTGPDGLVWIEYTTPNVGWANVVGDPADNAALVQYVEDHVTSMAETAEPLWTAASNRVLYVGDIANVAYGTSTNEAYRGDWGAAVSNAVLSHATDTENPHGVTAGQIGALTVEEAASTYQPAGDYLTGEKDAAALAAIGGVDLRVSSLESGTLTNGLSVSGGEAFSSNTTIVASFESGIDLDQYIAIKAGTTNSKRAYFAWFDAVSNDYRWLMGRNADNNFILFDRDAILHRLWFTAAGSSRISAGANGGVSINQDAGSGTNIYFYSGGASPTLIGDFRLGRNRFFDGPLWVTRLTSEGSSLLYLDAGLENPASAYVYFRDRGTAKWFIGKHADNRFVLYDNTVGKYMLTAQTGRVDIASLSVGGRVMRTSAYGDYGGLTNPPTIPSAADVQAIADAAALSAVAAVSGRVDTVEGWGDHADGGYLTEETDAIALGQGFATTNAAGEIATNVVSAATNALLDLAGTRAMTGDIVTLARDVKSRNAASVGECGAAFGYDTTAENYGAAFGYGTTAGDWGFSAGRNAHGSTGSFVFADSAPVAFDRTESTNSFSVRAAGGTYFDTPLFTVTGDVGLNVDEPEAQLDVGGDVLVRSNLVVRSNVIQIGDEGHAGEGRIRVYNVPEDRYDEFGQLADSSFAFGVEDETKYGFNMNGQFGNNVASPWYAISSGSGVVFGNSAEGTNRASIKVSVNPPGFIFEVNGVIWTNTP